jgi:hypothetical protein
MGKEYKIAFEVPPDYNPVDDNVASLAFRRFVDEALAHGKPIEIYEP